MAINYGAGFEYEFQVKTAPDSQPLYTIDQIVYSHVVKNLETETTFFYFETPQGGRKVGYTNHFIWHEGLAKVKKLAAQAVLYGLNSINPNFYSSTFHSPTPEPNVLASESKTELSSSPELRLLRKLIPGLATARANCPCTREGCQWKEGFRLSVVSLVIHLNDTVKWSREEIADWLETLDLDLRFQPPTEEGEQNGNSDQG